MRIVSGKFKGRRFNPPKNLPVRPTTDLAKEGLFNIINNEYYFEGLEVLDLFSGTGNIALEFESREVKSVTAVDQNSRCIRFIRSLNEDFDCSINIRQEDVFSYLKTCTQSFKIIFADPPYEFSKEQYLSIINTVFDRDLLKEEGLLITEHDSHLDLSDHPRFRNFKKYGGNIFSFFE
jgi:16S rRNA (guanine(966)-N(2))-methyltransferase RsmD